MAVVQKKAKRRTASKALRRQQLIRATIKSVAKRGFADTTMATVAKEAGLSQGIINLHFHSKNNLLIETLRFLADEYKGGWENALARAGPSAADKLSALVDLDFSRKVCDRNKLAVWFAFWGEAKSRPVYMKLCQKRDAEYDAVLQKLCRQLVEDGPYPGVDPSNIGNTLSALTDGLWLDVLMAQDHFGRDEARKIALSYLAHVFPEHFAD